MARLFGTDGVRGIANQSLTPELAFGLGQAAGIYFKKNATTQRTQVLIGKDTRLSGDTLEAALSAGLTSVGVDVIRLGIIPTPGVAYLCHKLPVEAGVMISASHNPVEDNGIKFFDHQGFKLRDEVEDEIEIIYKNHLDKAERPVGTGVGRITDDAAVVKLYEDHLVDSVPGNFKDIKVLVDCGYGAAYDIAPKVLQRLGAEVIPFHALNDGSRINVKCGSTNPKILQKEVPATGAHLGIALDGDADRIIAVDEQGHVVDGDQIITILGLDLLREGKLKNNKVAVTIYSNLGLVRTFKSHGVDVVTTPVGDRYVLEGMRKHDLLLGGEQSGHIIFLEKSTTGDGVLTALQIIAILVKTKEKLSVLAAQMPQYPQVLENVRVAHKEGWDANARIKESIAQTERELNGAGRVMVRASGTEPLIRVMAEGPDEIELKRLVGNIAATIREEQG